MSLADLRKMGFPAKVSKHDLADLVFEKYTERVGQEAQNRRLPKLTKFRDRAEARVVACMGQDRWKCEMYVFPPNRPL